MAATTLERATETTCASEAELERRLDRDRAIHAAVKGRNGRRSVARRFGISVVEVDLAVRAMDDSLKAITGASPDPAPRRAAAFPNARLRNLLVLDLGVPPDRVADAAYLAGVLTRSDLLATPRASMGTVDAVAAHLAGRGFLLRD